MKCEVARSILGPDPDHPSAASADVERARQHYAVCVNCQWVFATQAATVGEVRRIGRRLAAPPQLRERILARLDLEDERAQTTATRRRFPGAWRWASGGALATAALVALVVGVQRGNGGDDGLGAELARVVVTPGTPATEIKGADASEIARWLQSLVGYEVAIPAITRAVLTGGRITEIGNVPTAVVTYQLDGIPLSYFAFRSDPVPIEVASDRVQTSSSAGYVVATWTEYGAPRAIVAALPRDRVTAIAEECKRAAAPANAL